VAGDPLPEGFARPVAMMGLRSEKNDAFVQGFNGTGPASQQRAMDDDPVVLDARDDDEVILGSADRGTEPCQPSRDLFEGGRLRC
jgi:hypothetical protein